MPTQNRPMQNSQISRTPQVWSEADIVIFVVSKVKTRQISRSSLYRKSRHISPSSTVIPLPSYTPRQPGTFSEPSIPEHVQLLINTKELIFICRKTDIALAHTPDVPKLAPVDLFGRDIPAEQAFRFSRREPGISCRLHRKNWRSLRLG